MSAIPEIVQRFEEIYKIIHQKSTFDPYKRLYFSLIKISYTDHVLSHQKLDLLSRAKRLTQDISSSNFLVT